MRFLLTQAVTQATERHPDREAVRIGNSSLTYEQLEERSNAMAHTLVKQGVGRSDRVGIYMNKGLETVVAVYGIMKAGAAYVPLDPFAPTERLGYVVRDCDISCLITNEAKQEDISSLLQAAPTLECIIGIGNHQQLPVRSISWDEVHNASSSFMPASGAIEQDLAYILYTSGSTGDPKGIMHTHRSGLSFAEWAADTYSLNGEDRVSNHAPMHFDLSTFDMFATAIAGATLILIPEAITKFPASLSKLIEREQLTVWYSVPFALIQLLLRGGIEKRDLTSLRWILFAGEPFPTKHLRPLMSLLPHARFSNLFGPTETNVCTYYNLQSVPEDSDEPIPIGEPCANVDALVVDGDDQVVAPGEVGELLIRGPIVMRGYWGRPDLTDRGFTQRRLSPGFEKVYYRTGDLVQPQPDGNYKYLGRKDRQIKTRGYRVELDEIEVALLSHPAVEEAAAYPVPDGQGSNVIKAAVTTTAGTCLDPSVLASYLADRLPIYAIPVEINVLTTFPRTSTGKIDRRTLQAQAVAVAGGP